MTWRTFVVIFLCTIIVLLTLCERFLFLNLYFNSLNADIIWRKRAMYTKENQQLSDEILRNEALTTIAQKAKQRGMVPAVWVYLK